MGAALGMIRLELQEERGKRFDARYPLARHTDKARRELIAVAGWLVERQGPPDLAEKQAIYEVIQSLRNVACIIEGFTRPREHG